MALKFINHSTWSVITASTITTPKPTNTSDGDIMFAHVLSNGAYASSVPSGWTLLCQNTATLYYEVFYKVASSEPANYTFGTNVGKVTIITFRGDFDPNNPIGVISNTSYTVNNNSCIAASMNIVKNNSYVLFFAAAAGNGFSIAQPTGFTELYDNSVYSRENEIAISDVPYSQGSTGDMVATLVSVNTANKHAFAISVNPINNDKFFQFF